jgi:hypothetical protein
MDELGAGEKCSQNVLDNADAVIDASTSNVDTADYSTLLLVAHRRCILFLR